MDVADLALKALLGCAPVLIFLATLKYFDSFKLVRLPSVLVLMSGGVLAALAAMIINSALMDRFDIDYVTYSHFGAPVIEEVLKISIIAWYIRTDRVGFAFDAAILGGAAGTGFAVVENIFYLAIMGDQQMALWAVRGFGTAIMHAATAMVFATLAHGFSLRADKAGLREFLPGLAIAIIAHGLFNNLVGEKPIVGTMVMMLIFPAMLSIFLRRDAKSIDAWLAFDFAAHEALLHDLNRGNYLDRDVGRMLDEMRSRFGDDAADLVHEYLLLHIKLVLAAEHLLEAHHRGDPSPPSKEVEDELLELRAVEESLGPTLLMALRPHLHFTRKELWDIYYLEREEHLASPHAH